MSDFDRLREEIAAADREIFAAVNRRLELVQRLERYKEENGIAFADPEREATLVAERLAENEGPLSDEGLRAFYVELLALCKRELARRP
jgi:chorismate mutase / prephenate dehydratase